MKRVLLVFISALVVIVVIGLNLFPLNIKHMEDGDTIKDSSSRDYTSAFVTDSGKCYVNGVVDVNRNYGVANPSIIQNFNEGYIEIYDKGDAETISISDKGGCIITNSGEVYVFCNELKGYKTPVYLCSGYKQAYLADETLVYLLSENNELGYISIEYPNDFVKIGDDIKRFKIGTDRENDYLPSVLSLSENGDLYITSYRQRISESAKIIDNVSDFDFVMPNLDTSVLSVLTKDHEALCLKGEYPLNYEGIIQESFKKVGENITDVISYEHGVAMMDDHNNLYLYGYGFKDGSDYGDFFSGEKVFSDVKAVYGGDIFLIVVWNDNSFTYYGKHLDKLGYTRITKDNK